MRLLGPAAVSRLACLACLGAFVTVAAATAACSLVALDGFSSGNDGALVNDAGGAATADGGDGSPPATAGEGGTLGGYPAAVLSDRPVAWYRFEEAAGATSAKDELGGRAATSAEAAGFGVPGLIGNGVALGGEPVFEIGDAFDFSGKVPFALELWVRPERRNHDQLLISKRGDNGGGLKGYILYLGSDLTVHFEAWGVGMSAWTEVPIPSSTIAPAGKNFVHIVVSVSYATGKGNATLYVDAERAPNGGYDNTENLADTTIPFGFGRDLHGTLDELAIYDHELSPERILAHWQAGRRP